MKTETRQQAVFDVCEVLRSSYTKKKVADWLKSRKRKKVVENDKKIAKCL